MPEYTYRFANLLADTDIAELELSNVKFDRRIIVPGKFSGAAAVTNLDIATQVKKIVPGRTIVHVYRDADIWGTYIIWSVRVRSSPRGPVLVEFQGATLESWLYKRIVDTDLSFDEIDQFDIARELIDTAQTGWAPYAANANLSITYDSNDSGVPRDRTYYVAEAASIGQRLQELANVDNGFEYMIHTYVDTDLGMRVRKFVIQTELGSVNQEAVFTYPGSILNYEIDYDATEAATAFWARGDTIEEDITATTLPLMTDEPALADTWLQNGFPHMDKVVDYSSVIKIETLEDYAAWWKNNRAGLWAVPVIEINTTDTPTLITPALLGSRAMFTVVDEYFGMVNSAPEFSYRNRVVGIEVNAPERGNAESIRYVIEQSFDPTETGE